MNGIVINIDPVIFQVGGFELRWYGVAIMLAVAAAVLIAAQQSKKKGIAPLEIYSLAFWAVIAGLVGARLVHVLDHFGYYVNNPFEVLQVQQGGLAIWGALAGGGLVVVLYARIKHIPLGRFADALAPALLTAHIIGRLGCVINGDAYGGVTGMPWGFIYAHPNALIAPSLFGLPTHPYPAYEIIWNAIALLVIWQVGRHFKKDGLVFLSYLSLYSLGRFVLTFVRQENVTLWGLQQAQIIGLLGFLIALLAMMYLARERLLPEKVTEP